MSAQYRKDFGFFTKQDTHQTVYLDSSATTQKLNSVIASTSDFMQFQNASVHRSAYPLANQATGMFEGARDAVASFINAKSNEVIFTSGATESLNLIARGLQVEMLSGNTILICESEHHANILPWQDLAQRFKLQIKVLRLAKNGKFDSQTLEQWLSLIDEDVAIFACAQVSNVLGNIYPVEALCKKAKQVNALSVIDGTQAVAHIKVDVQSLGCDFYVFSGHKMYAATGIGICWGRLPLFERLAASKLGGEMVSEVSFSHYTTQAPPLKFEAGTPNVAGAIGLQKAIQFLQLNVDAISKHEDRLWEYLISELKGFDELHILGNTLSIEQANKSGRFNEASVGIVSFYSSDLDNHSLALMLYQQGIALRYGQHCAMPLLASLGINACLRVSLGCYNDKQDVDAFIRALREVLNQIKSDSAQGAKEILSPNKVQDATSQTGSKQTLAMPHEQAIVNAKNWPEKHRQLLLLSKSLPLLPFEQRTQSNEVKGCEARVWLEIDSTNQSLLAYSDSKVVRGILALLVLKQNQNTKALTQDEFDYEAYLHDLGLADYFSAGRKDGIRVILQRLASL